MLFLYLNTNILNGIFDRWELVLAPREGEPAIKHLEKVKILVNGEEKISPWAGYVLQPAKELQAREGTVFSQHFWQPSQEERHKRIHPRPSRPASLRFIIHKLCSTSITYSSVLCTSFPPCSGCTSVT